MQLRVLYAFAAEEEGELSVEAGDVVTLLDDSSADRDGWVLVESTRPGAPSGFIPSDYAQPIPAGTFSAPAAGIAAPSPVPPTSSTTATAANAYSSSPTGAYIGGAPLPPYSQPLHQQQSSPLVEGGSSLRASAPQPPAGQQPPPPQSLETPSVLDPLAMSRMTALPSYMTAKQPAPSSVAAYGGSGAGGHGALMSMMLPSPSSVSSGTRAPSGPLVAGDEYAQLFATHEEWFKAATAKRQEVYRSLNADAMDIARTAAEAESRSSALVTRLAELEALIADERSKWQARIMEETAAVSPAAAASAMLSVGAVSAYSGGLAGGTAY